MIADSPTYELLCLEAAWAMQIGFTTSLNEIGRASLSRAVQSHKNCTSNESDSVIERKVKINEWQLTISY